MSEAKCSISLMERVAPPNQFRFKRHNLPGLAEGHHVCMTT